MDRLELEVQVTADTGQPLAGAVVWYNGDRGTLRDGKPDEAAMQRMARRYANQSDFLDTGDVPGTIFERTNLQGIYRDAREIGNVPDNLYPYVFVATKRGYVAQVIGGRAPLNKQHRVTFKLQRDPQALPVDPRMEVFDRLMARARAVEPNEEFMGEARMHKLVDLNQQVRKLALDLEQTNRGDDASAVYWALADFPSVTVATGADGQTQIVGYANGRTGPQSELDRLKATQLNTRVPKLLIDKAIVSWGFPRVGVRNAAEGLAYLKAFEAAADGPLKEGVLPRAYIVAIYQAAGWGTPEQACDLIQRAYRFEPVTLSVERWWGMLERIADQRKRLKLPPQPCVVDGLPSL
ncbi:MAG: hypothetical protein EOP38_09840 [Rubrivivax sp.]|nr:MAG: hypothetical protein EOP38_09840 [Rubrivivax sp.]